ncbi:MAG: DNA-primase RepB domain-containing protein [Christensenella sp.]|uniref:DNA-primase RepB domain-containing protein n=1 Tax=Christensenella sp. TaxID=1935934 RepID=UPI002B1F34BF|nr:DNA-primase RepB domain-containing protein [Christensenella sp.]MEA5002745.1 DNA-primase RepB domain-containing protein [Christensenella sp.]
MLPEPNYVVRTSEKKLQAVWLVQRPMSFGTAEAALLFISTKTGGDAAVKDLSRVLRLPGFKNTKLKSGDWPVTAEKRHDKKLETPLVEGLASAGRDIRTSARSSIIKDKPVRPSSLSSSVGGVVIKPASASLILAEIGPVPVGRALKHWENIYGEKKNKTLADWGMCCYLRGVDASEETMLDLLRRVHNDDDGRKGNDEYYRDTVRHCLEQELDIL